MNLDKIFKQLKNIEPENDYARGSRARILGSSRWSSLPRRRPFQIILQALQSGSAIALAGVALLLVLGGLSLWRVLDLVGLSGLDPAGLKAEAQAVDLQIQLSNLNYADIEGPSAVSTISGAGLKRVRKPSTPQTNSFQAESTSSVDIDSALDILSQ